MARFPHELRRDGLFTPAWTLRGPLIAGRFVVPRGERPGIYESRSLRLEYRAMAERRHDIEFTSPQLSREGDRVRGEVRTARTHHAVWVASRGTGAEGVEMPVLAGGFLRRRNVLLAPHGSPIAAVTKKSGWYDVDIPENVFSAGNEPGAGGKERLYEAAIAMLLAEKIESDTKNRAAVAGAAAGAAAGATHAMTGQRRQGDA